MAVVLEVRSAQGNISLQRIHPGRNRITVRPGDTYRLVDEETRAAPDGMTVKRADNHIVIDGFDRQAAAGGNPTVVELSDFYGTCSVASPCQVVVESASAAPVVLTPTSQSIGALADGSYVLYDPAYVATESAPASSDDGAFGLSRPMLYGLGGVGIAALALAGGGGGGSGGDPGPTPSDGQLRVTSPTSINTRTPVITGTGEPGSTVQVQFDLNRDGASDVRYDVRVGSDGRWSLDLATAAPAAGSLPAGGVADGSRVLVSSTGTSGPTSLPLLTFTFDDVPPAPARVDPITVDSVISAPEKQAGIAVTGSAEAGGTVVVTWGSVQKVAAVDANGRWTAAFASAEIPGDGQSRIDVVARDLAGNAAAPTTAEVRISTSGPLLEISQIGSDSDASINAAEAAAGVQVRGRADANAHVSVAWNGQVLPTIADASGAWAVQFGAGQVPNPTNAEGATIPLVATAVNPVGNTSNLQVNVVVDRVAPTAPTISAVEGDDRVSLAERGDGVPISGTAEALSLVAVTWGGTTRTVNANASGQWTTTFTVDQVPTPTVGGGSSFAVSARATDVAGNAGAQTPRAVFVEAPFAAPVISPVEGNDLVTAAERADGVVISGTVETGAPGVVVTWGSFTQTVVPTGTTWSVNVPAAQVPADGIQNVVAAIAVTDGATARREVRVDAIPPAAPTIATVSGDGRVTLPEKAAGLVISGTGEAGSTANVTIGGTTQTAAVGAGGGWQVRFEPAQVGGEGANTALVTLTDAVGNNSAPASASYIVATASQVSTVAGDGIVTGTERGAGFAVTGIGPVDSPAGTAIVVTLSNGAGATASRTVATAAGGGWSATFGAPTDNLPDGAYTVSAVGSIGGVTGVAGTAPATIDGTPPTATINPVTGDNIVTPAEAAAGVTLSGRAEPGATVAATFEGMAVGVAVAGDGSWTSGPLPSAFLLSPGTRTVTATATDSVGNVGPTTTLVFSTTGSPMATTLGDATTLHAQQLFSDAATPSIDALATATLGFDPATSLGALIDESPRA